jgi:hypothetical protein
VMLTACWSLTLNFRNTLCAPLCADELTPNPQEKSVVGHGGHTATVAHVIPAKDGNPLGGGGGLSVFSRLQ